MSTVPPPADQFWLLTGAVPTGPFTLAQVHAELAAGLAAWDTRACRVGDGSWLPLTQVPGIGPSAPPDPPTLAPADGAPARGLQGAFGAKGPPSSTDAPAPAGPVNEAAAAGGASSRQKAEAQSPPPGSAATPIEVRCGCGRLVAAEERFAGQHVRCPHCQTSVAVPVAAAAAVPPPAPERSVWDSETGRMWSMVGGFVLLVVLVGLYKGCRDDAEKNRPPMKEIMQKARDKTR